MKRENKIPLAHIKDGIEQYKNTAYTSKEWETLLYGWRQKKHYRKRETNKGWLKTEDATSLIQYALNDRVKIAFAHFATFIV